MLMWYPLAESLIWHLRSIPELAERFNIGPAGVADDVNKESKIEVEWDSESDPKEAREGKVILYVNVNLRTDEVDALKNYKAQHETQEKILASMRIWQEKLVRELCVAVHVKVSGVTTLGKMMQPNYVARIVLLLNWRKKTL